ncbi:hypothetical protein D9T17_06315 [Lysobacter enzymogenes]|uniref:Uncharacterized protein n=1 Tax=Lysobacter enzymogenes TaxID=69 RepID=A0A3N2RKF4_LYSEN|nr:hypothetical protein D9T17_06315 [Lysobacter enzymogenes]
MPCRRGFVRPFSCSRTSSRRHAREGGKPGLHRDMTLKPLDSRLRGNDGLKGRVGTRQSKARRGIARLRCHAGAASFVFLLPHILRPSFPRMRESRASSRHDTEASGFPLSRE